MALRFMTLSLEEYLETSKMPYELLPNGNILHRRGVFDSVQNLHTIAPVEILPSDTSYSFAIDWLSDEEAERARVIQADYRAHHAQAS